MKTDRLLYLSAYRMTAYRWHSGALESEGMFAANDEGHQQFADYVKQHRQATFTLLANVSEEGFHIETIPFLQGKDRKTVIERKLGQQFFSAPLTASLSLGYAKSKRKDERVLLAALTNNELFTPWITAITSHGAALSGVYSLPLVSVSLLKKLKLGDEQCLLLTVQDQSIRQSYFEKGELHFSRLTPLQNSSISGIAQTFFSEAIKLQQYLASQRLIGRNQPITTHVLAHGSTMKAIQASCNDTPTIRFNFLGIEDCATKTGLKTVPFDAHSENLFLHLLRVDPPRIQFANDDQRHTYHLGLIRSTLHAVGAAVLAGCLLYSATLLYETYEVTDESQGLRAESSQARQRYAEIVKTFPPIPTNNETLRQVIDRYVAIDKGTASPIGLYRELSRALQSAPAAELDALEWRVGGIDAATGQAANSAYAASAVSDDSETLIVRGTLKTGTSNARQTLAAFNTLIDALKANPKLQVVVLQSPFDIESGKSLKGSDTAVDDHRPRAFSLQIVRKLAS
ncbi:MAG: hypothetical protein KAX66_00625 [Propionivibrio sp.]|nr:hypothetical protein [Propionivibrio sp.]